MFVDYFASVIKGFLLSGGVYAFGIFLDVLVSHDTKENLVKESEDLLKEAESMIQTNLLIISPLVYGVVDHLFLTHTNSFDFIDFTALILTQNLGYFFVHREMHRNKKIYWMHKFHHQFDRILIPSIGNAVSVFEFCLAYIVPIVGGAAILKPSEISFMASIGTISVFNLLIHTQELNGIWWIPGMVSPSFHIKHHEERDKHYAAPLIDLDLIFMDWELVEVEQN